MRSSTTFRRAATGGRLLAGASLTLLPGCFTSGLWDWAEDGGRVVDARPDEVTGWVRRTIPMDPPVRGAVDDGFDVRVRWSDGSSSTERVGVWCEGSPAHLVLGARAWAESGRPPDDEHAAWLLLLATSRGWPGRDFAQDPAFAGLADQPQLLEACAAPVTSPTFALRPMPGRDGAGPPGLWLKGTRDETCMLELPPRSHGEGGGPLGYAAAVVATPVTVALDIVTSPAQLVFVVLLGRSLGGVGGHTQ